MTFRRLILCATIGLSLSLPTSGLAGHHDNEDHDSRPNAPHDQGWHKGWYKHHEERDDDDRDYSDEYHRHYHQPEVRYRAAAPDGRRRYEDDDDNYRRICDEDGDDCHVANEHYWGGYDYGPPASYYQGMPPSAYNLGQQRDWLIQRRQQGYYVLAKMRARGDRKAANRMLKVINGLDARIAANNRRMAGGGSAPSIGVPYAGDPYGAVYNPNNPATDPTVNAVKGMVGPILGLPPY